METVAGDTVDQVFNVSSPARLSLNTVSGSVDIKAGEEETIRVRATKTGSDEAKANTTVELEQNGNQVSVNTRNDRQGSFLGRGGKIASVDYLISVPRGTAVEVKTVSADVQVYRTAGDLQAQTVSGDLTIAEAQGVLAVNTVSGDVVANGLSGTLTLHSTSGDARITSSSLRDFNLHSVSGDFYLDTPLTTGEHYYAHTVSGDLQLRVPSGTGVTVQMKSVSGDVHTGFANANIIRSGRRHWQGRINGGGANLEMQSVSGDLSIVGGDGEGRSPEPTASAGADTGEPQARPSEAGDILRALEQGEIDVDEALARLRGRR